MLMSISVVLQRTRARRALPCHQYLWQQKTSEEATYISWVPGKVPGCSAPPASPSYECHQAISSSSNFVHCLFFWLRGIWNDRTSNNYSFTFCYFIQIPSSIYQRTKLNASSLTLHGSIKKPQHVISIFKEKNLAGEFFVACPAVTESQNG